MKIQDDALCMACAEEEEETETAYHFLAKCPARIEDRYLDHTY